MSKSGGEDVQLYCVTKEQADLYRKFINNDEGDVLFFAKYTTAVRRILLVSDKSQNICFQFRILYQKLR